MIIKFARIIGVVASLSFAGANLFASVPEPSSVIEGEVQFPNGDPVQQEGMRVFAVYQGRVLDEVTLSSANSYKYALEIPLEADVGTSNDPNKVKVGSVVSVGVEGQALLPTIKINDRGTFWFFSALVSNFSV